MNRTLARDYAGGVKEIHRSGGGTAYVHALLQSAAFRLWNVAQQVNRVRLVDCRMVAEMIKMAMLYDE